MASLNVPDVLSTPDELAFLTLLGSSVALSWKGLFAFNQRLKPVSLDIAPTIQSDVESIVLQTSGAPHTITLSHFSHVEKGISGVGQLSFFPRNLPLKVGWAKSVENISFGVQKELLEEVAAETRRGDPDQIALHEFGLIDDPMISQIGWMLLSLIRDGDLSSKLYAESLGVTLAHHLLYKYHHNSRRRSIPAQSSLSQQQIRAAVDYIHANFAHELSLSEIASSAGLSVAHFSRLFRQAMRCSPHQYLIRCRVENAYSLLKQEKYTIADIAQQVGFYDQSHLVRHFKRIYGVSPTRLIS